MNTRNEKSAWITGGGSGIGLGIAHALADRGYAVYLSGRDEAKLERVSETYAEEHPDASGRLVALPADVRDGDSIGKAARAIRDEKNRLDVLVTAAGVNVKNRTLDDTTADDWRYIIDTNATGPFLTIKEALPLLRASAPSVVVNIVSVSGLKPLLLGGAAYCASKFAQSSLGTFAGNELADAGIRVTNIYPGEVNTPILDQRSEPPGEEERALMVQPEDIGDLVALIVGLPPRAHISEVTIKPATQQY